MLTERIVRDARPRSKPYVVWDGQVKGLGCRIHPTGRKVYVFSYRAGPIKRYATLGRCADMSLRDARDFAREEIGRVGRGGDDLFVRRGREREAPSVDDALGRFFDETVPERIASGRMTERTAREYGKHARRYMSPALGVMKVKAVTRRDVERLASSLADRAAQRNRVIAFVSVLFNWTERWEWRSQRTNPVRGIERAREKPRRRILSDDEFSALSRVLGGREHDRAPSVAAIRVAALTGLRISEVITMRWADVDLVSGRMHLPDTKTGSRSHRLPSAALAEVRACFRLNDHIFTYGRSAPVTYRTIRKHFAEFVAEAGLEDVRLHDLRRTLMTRAAAGGESAFVIRDLLGHRTMAMASRYVQEAGLAVEEARERAGSGIASVMDIVPVRDSPGD